MCPLRVCMCSEPKPRAADQPSIASAFHPNFQAVARSWTKVPNNARDRHFFASLDFGDGASVFRAVRGHSNILAAGCFPTSTYSLAMRRLLTLCSTQPKQGLTRRPLTWANGSTISEQSKSSHFCNRSTLLLIALLSSFEAGALAEHLSRSTPVKVPYRPPPNYALVITSAVSIISLAIMAKFFWPLFAFFILSRWTWALACILSSLIFTSGYMFTRIRNVPFAQNTRQGPQWIAGGYSNQLGAETYVISTLCTCIASDSRECELSQCHRWGARIVADRPHFTCTTDAQAGTATPGDLYLVCGDGPALQHPDVDFQGQKRR